jgi:hypothetical protein
MSITMEERLDHARAALTAYFAEKGEPERNNDEYEDTDVSDLIADLLHLQKNLNLRDINKTLATALMHFEAEQEEHGQPPKTEAQKEFTTKDADRLLGLADQFLEDWKDNEGKNDPECAARRAEWGAIRPQLASAPKLLNALRQAVAALNAKPRFPVPEFLTDSYKVAALYDEAIAEASGSAA